MIVLNKQPQAVNLAGNPVILDITGTRMYSNVGSKAGVQIGFFVGGTVTNGMFITFTIGITNITVTFKDNPNSEYFEFKTGLIDIDWELDFATFLNSIYFFHKYYDISGGVLIVAKEKGSKYNISCNSNLGSLDIFIYATGTDPVIRTGYQLFAVLSNITSDTVVAEEAITPNSNQNAVFDFSEYLISELEKQRLTSPSFTYPNDGGTIFFHPEFLFKFYLQYAEKFDGIVQKFTTSGCFISLLGGLNRAKLDELATTSKTFYDLFSETGMFLTMQPSIKITGNHTPERLYFLNYTGAECAPKIRQYFSNNDENILTLDLIDSQVSVYEIIVSTNSFSGLTYPLVKLKVYIEDLSGNLISEEKWYKVDQTYYLNEYYFLFRNSLGGYDTLRCTGVMKAKPEFDREIFTNDDNETSVYQTIMEQVFEINTGSLSADMAGWINDFMLSTEVYWLNNRVAYPITVTSKKKTVLNNTDRRFNVEFEFSVSAKDKFYSAPSENGGFNINQTNPTGIVISR